MCGLNGIFAYQAAASNPSRAELLTTRERMASRGPDGAGEWWSPGGRCALAFRRLAIQDLSDRASQPMVSHGGSFVTVFNGEIYNFRELRAEFEQQGVSFRTTADTEVLLHLYAREGEAMVHRLRGMFAFVIWDEARGGLFLARDPYGIKPLYTANDGWTFRFASQVKALLAGGRVSRDPEPAGIVGFHLFGSVPEPFTLYRDIRALPAGYTQWVDAAGPREPKSYVSIPAVIAGGARSPEPSAEVEMQLRSALSASVAAHLIADVDVGIFLSAGIDSGALLGLMRDAGAEKIRAITISYDEFAGTPEDEAPLAAQVAQLYGAQHVTRVVGASEFQADLPAIIDAMDQPSIDGVNTWFVAKAGREAGLKVALSGLGADELLGGYPSFRDLPRWTAWLRFLGAPGVGAAARRLAALAAPRLRTQAPKALGLVEFGSDYPGAYLVRRGLFLPFELKHQLDSELVTEGLRRLSPRRRLACAMRPDPGTPFGRVSALESTQYMKNQLLRDADWAGMAHSLEIRTPLVDIRLLEAVAPIMPHLALDLGKKILARAPSTALPQAIVQRPKTGFGVPLGEWLGPEGANPANKGLVSRDWARELWRRRAGEALTAT